MTVSAAAPRRSRWAKALQVAGIVGIVVSLVVIALIWFGRGFVSGGVDNLASAVNDGINHAISATDRVARRLDAASTEVSRVVTQATEVAGNRASNQARARLSDRLSRFADRYRQLRVAYAGIRAEVTTAVTTLRRVGRLVPGVELPRGPTDTLAAIDSNLQSLDEAVTSILPAGEAPITAAAATAVANKATPIRSTIDRTSGRVQALGLELQGVRADAVAAANSIRTTILLATIALTIVFVWVLLLNVALWKLGRTMAVQSQSAGPVQAAASPPATAGPPPAAPPPAAPPPAASPPAASPPAAPPPAAPPPAAGT
jgi:hypothetical protein